MLSRLRLPGIPLKNNWCLVAVALLWLAGLNAAPKHFAELADSALAHQQPDAALAASAALPGDTSISATICANEFYVFDGDSINQAGQYSAVFTASDGSDSIVSLDLTVLPLLAGGEAVTICGGNAYTFDGQLLSQTGTYQAVLIGSNGCDSVATLELTVLPSVATKLDASICIGSHYIFQGDTLTASGIYTATFPAANGCDSLVVLDLDVVPFFDQNLSVSICAGESYIFGADTLDEAGVYVDSLTATGGCDSVVTLRLSVLPIASTFFEIGVCTGSSYIFQGDTLTQSGTYVESLTAVNGCDSVVVLALTVADYFDVLLETSICAGESYIFGNDTLRLPGVYTDSLTAAGGCDSTVTLTLSVLPVQTSTATATICAGDTLDVNGRSLTEAGVYDFILTGENGCDSTVTLTLSVLPTSATSLQATICKGETYDFNGDTLAAPGIYTQTLPAANGCDSTLTLTLTVLPTSATLLEATICDNEALDFNGDTLTTAGTYLYTFAAQNGCDSTVTLTLNVLPTSSDIVDAAICAGEIYVFNNDTLRTTGHYTYLFAAANGCDSTVTLVLDVLPAPATALADTICDTYAYPFNGQNLTMPGIYEAILTAANGCDSTVTLTLSVLPVQTSSFSVSTCAGTPYVFNNQALTQSGSFDFILGGANGCDSTVTVNLTVLPVPQTSVEASICAGDFYEYDGDTLSTAGAYTFKYVAANGCDSVVTVQLEARPLLSSDLNLSLCEGSSYLFGGDTLTASGIYTDTLSGSNGCDSIATLRLTFLPGFETKLEASICNGESYEFDGQNLTESGMYNLDLTATGGCDSLVTLTLTVLPLSSSTSTANICAGATYAFNGQNLTESGTYTATLIGANGCDSTAVLQLTVLSAITTNIAATLCFTETYPFNGDTLSASGNYTATLVGSNGCDSTVVLDLTVLPAQSSILSATICAGDAYEYAGDTLTAAGNYDFVLKGTNGCDSTVTLQLAVLPLAQGAFAAVVCEGKPFEYNGQVLSTSGTYSFTFPGAAANGCDSLVTLSLTIFPVIPPTEVAATVCAGQSYDFYGTVLTQSGNYTAQLPSATGCDSTIALALIVRPAISSVFTVGICTGDSYTFNGQSLSAPGTYSAVLPAANGCDSTVTLTLQVFAVNTAVTLQSSTLTAQAANASYQWINCNGNTPIAGATGVSYTPAASGDYAVAVTENGCTDTSACQFVQVVSAYEPLVGVEWSLLPNPASLHTTVVFQTALSETLWLQIYDPTGRLLRSQQVDTGTQQIELDLQGLPDGLLFVRLFDAQKATTTKGLVKAEN